MTVPRSFECIVLQYQDILGMKRETKEHEAKGPLLGLEQNLPLRPKRYGAESLGHEQSIHDHDIDEPDVKRLMSHAVKDET